MSHTVAVRPIRSEKDLDAALARIDQIFHAAPGSAEADELDVLATLVRAYESEHHPILPPDPVDMLEFWMDQKGMTRADLVPYLGAQSRVSEVLSRKRKLTLGMIRKLHSGLGIPLDGLIG